MEEAKQEFETRSHAHRSTSDTRPCLETDLVVLSHLRWDFVFQRPQHLMTRFARHRRVFFVEEPLHEDRTRPEMRLSSRENGLVVATPLIPHGTPAGDAIEMQRLLLQETLESMSVREPTFWYYTPMALSFTRGLAPRRVIYDCMDQLSAFKNAPPELTAMEEELLSLADHVFTGGHSLYEAKRDMHESVHAFPSSIDRSHFGRGREACDEPADQCGIPRPRIGFFGVVDERMDIELLGRMAEIEPEWHFVVIGPVVKIDPASLPQNENIHYLGMKSYAELPSYLSHWDAAMLPFAMNESTRFISPTKTPEYLAAGKPVVSTPIRDVVRPYGDDGLVGIASTAEEFVGELERRMSEAKKADREWLTRVDDMLSRSSWDSTWESMARLERAVELASMN